MFEYCSWHDQLPDESLEVCENNLKLFFKTMYERQSIWNKRVVLKLPQPWTNDKFFKDFKFTNVYRELDRNSQWQIKHIIRDSSLTLKNLIWKMMVFRYFNNPATFEFAEEVYGWGAGIPDYEDYNKETFAEMIREMRKKVGNPYTTAYLINSMATPGHTRDYCYTEVVIPKLHDSLLKIIAKVVSAKSAEVIIEYLKTLPAVADFIAHEFYQDFTYIPRYTDRKFMKFDQNDYTNVGPGASIGIRLIYPNLKGRDQKKAIYWLKEQADKWMVDLGNEKEKAFLYLGWDAADEEYFTYEFDKYKEYSKDKDARMYSGITLHQIEMWLCEFQKYWKMTIGQGKQRSKFTPQT